MAPSGRMGADIDHRAREALVRHAGHGDEKLPVEIARFAVVVSRSVQELSCYAHDIIVHAVASAITGSWMAALRQINRIREARQGGVSSMTNRVRVSCSRLFVAAALPGRRARPAGASPGCRGCIRACASSPADRRASAGSPASRSRSIRASRPIGAHRAKPACRPRFDWSGSAEHGRGRGPVAGAAAASRTRRASPTSIATGSCLPVLIVEAARSGQAGRSCGSSSNTASARRSASRPAPS